MNKLILENKQNEVKELTQALQNASSFLFFEYTKFTGRALTAFRRTLHDNNCKLYVKKNNIFSRAVKELSLDNDIKIFGSFALIVSNGDALFPFKTVYELSKDNSNIKYKYGIFEKKLISPDQFTALATLPNREQLYSMLLSVLQAPIRNLLYGLKSVGETKK